MVGNHAQSFHVASQGHDFAHMLEHALKQVHVHSDYVDIADETVLRIAVLFQEEMHVLPAHDAMMVAVASAAYRFS